ncbi:phosphotransferase enzyme family protein [Paenibacillus sacheonensis]|uniref:Phosphotransferase n=1 Tax=Paenibacillus sacheonensis TaxID=742054 RepID=A0A7X5BZA0_9BACL|nr:phosphotransferase [Paenibacillus sacheonensis]MBM7568640.1 Ser/Thr protein kinase RdoA (MazF antagonist) [Paenibacillus sacheonensis]NBC72468.1 phosphotransferase [Paenibacillus sacheonensis]
MQSNDAITVEILACAARQYRASGRDAAYIGGSQNSVYEYVQDGRSFILRLTPCGNRSESLVRSELDWILFLADAGISVSKPIRSKNGRWTEVIPSPEGSRYTCVVFEKAPGRQIGYPECLEDHGLHERLGRLTGRLHAVSQTYQPQAPITARHDWRQNWFLQHMDLLPESQAGVVPRAMI